MSILAEPRRKQKISIDPNNLQWKNDDNKLSKKMMENMGWSEGKGLGKNKNGNVDFVKLKANRSGKGFGADKLAGYDSTWIGHHDDFADLLATLNKNKPKEDETEEEKKERTNKMSIELSSKNLRRRIHYQKFTRMKDTSNYTDNDKSAVLGVGLKRTKDEPVKEKKESSDSDEGVNQGNTTVSTLSVGDYFAAKMAALKSKSQTCAVAVKEETLEIKEEIADDYEETVQNYNSIEFSYDKPIKKEEDDDKNYNFIGFSYGDAPVDTSEDEKTRGKREKKERKQKEAELSEIKAEPVEDDAEKRQKRKDEKRQRKLLKKQKEAEVEVKEEPVEEMTEKQRRKMEKRLKKKQHEEIESELLEQVVDVVEEKNKKKKRDQVEVEEAEEPKKKKKKSQA